MSRGAIRTYHDLPQLWGTNSVNSKPGTALVTAPQVARHTGRTPQLTHSLSSAQNSRLSGKRGKMHERWSTGKSNCCSRQIEHLVSDAGALASICGEGRDSGALPSLVRWMHTFFWRCGMSEYKRLGLQLMDQGGLSESNHAQHTKANESDSKQNSLSTNQSHKPRAISCRKTFPFFVQISA